MEDNHHAGVAWGNPWAGIFGRSTDELISELEALKSRISSAETAPFSNPVNFEIPGWAAGIRETCQSWLIAIDGEIENLREIGEFGAAEQSIYEARAAWNEDFTSTGLFTYEPAAVIYENFEPVAKCVQLGPNVLATFSSDEATDVDL